MSLLQNSNAIETGGYPISNSLRFQSASSQYLAKTGFTANRNIQTLSVWVKRGALGTRIPILGTYAASATYETFEFTASDTLRWQLVSSGTTYVDIATTAVFRDPSAWYHVMFVNTGSVFNLYVNGVQVTWSGTGLNFGQVLFGEPTYSCRIGYNQQAATYFDGYMAELNFVSGSALTPSSFGETNTLTGQWVAKKYTGTYGTNGFYLPFSNGTSTTTLGADSSGNGNNWTLTNFTRSAGVSDCWMYDVPSGNGGASGTQPSSNYAVLNPLTNAATNPSVESNGNLKWASPGTSYGTVFSSIGVSSGKWYWEVIPSSTSGGVQIGIATSTASNTTMLGGDSQGWSYYSNTGNKYNNNTATAYGSTVAANDVVGVALDIDVGTITFYKNNTSQGTAFTGLSGTFFASISDGSNTLGSGADINFGQRSFAYTPPSGFKALCTANLPASTIVKGNKYMDATLYTGTSANQTITNAGGFKPDLVWCKARSFGYAHVMMNSIAGANQYLIPNATNAEGTFATGLTSFNSNGFSLGADTTSGAWNYTGVTYVGWQWQAGQGTTSSNTSGSITSTVSVNATAGFSVVTWTAPASGTYTVGHGLGVKPAMYIVKSRSTGSPYGWYVWHQSFASNTNDYIQLESTAAKQTYANMWGASGATSSTLGANINISTPANATQVAYCFAEIAGFSKFGSYTSNGSADGTFVYCGFKPRFIMFKDASNGTLGWVMYDTARNTYNLTDSALYPSASNAEGAYAGVDVLSNGFKVRSTATAINNSTDTIIYAAFAESPFANSNAR